MFRTPFPTVLRTPLEPSLEHLFNNIQNIISKVEKKDLRAGSKRRSKPLFSIHNSLDEKVENRA